MDPAHLTSARFWESDANHIAINPLRHGDADGLDEFARGELGARGWCFFQTSGSEGNPKWVGLTKEAFLISARAVNVFFEATTDDRWLVALPLNHVGGFSIYARCFVSGASADVMEGKWDAVAFADVCAEKGTTLVSLVPAQVFDLVSQRIAAPRDVRAVIVGGGALAPGLRERAIGLGWPICCSYGMTETASQIATQSAADGAVVSKTAMQVLPHWNLTADAEGVLTVRGAALAEGYASRDRDGRWQWQAIDAKSGLQTRDRVRLWQQDGRSYLEFAGRDSSFIKISGELVNRDALQARLDETVAALRFPTCAFVVPVGDERRGASIVIAVERDRSTGKQRAMLKERFDAASLPFERAIRVHELISIPLSSLGKPLIARMAEMIGPA